MTDKTLDFERSRFPEPAPSLAPAVVRALNINLDRLLELRGRPVVLWGWHSSEANTMVFEHETLRRTLKFLGFNTTWFSSKSDPKTVLSEIPGPKLFVTGNPFGDQLATVTSADDIVIVHNDENPGRWNCQTINYQQYLATFDVSYPGIRISYPCDLLPQEINPEWLNCKDNNLAFFSGSPYNLQFQREHGQLRDKLQLCKIDYHSIETWNAQFVHKAYVVSRFAPVPQMSIVSTFLPSRFCKAMARGCIPLSINPFLKHLLGWGADGCIFGTNWTEVAEQVREIKENQPRMNEMSRVCMEYAKHNSALHFFESIFPPRNESAIVSSTFREIRENLAQARKVLAAPQNLRSQIEVFRGNRAFMICAALAAKWQSDHETLSEVVQVYRQDHADDAQGIEWLDSVLKERSNKET